MMEGVNLIHAEMHLSRVNRAVGASPPYSVQKKKGRFALPSFVQNCFELLLGGVEFHAVAGVHIFQREDDHGGR
jgi:hypothetical protein